VCLLLPVLPGPEIIFQPVHEKSLANPGKSLANFRPQILQAKFFFFSDRNFSHLATLAANQPPTPTSPSLPPAQLAKY
jgi:hypothetical protein